MSLADDLREAVATVRTETLDLHVKVLHKMWVGQSFEGTLEPEEVVRLAIAEKKQQFVQGLNGQQVLSKTYIALLEEIKPNGAEGRSEPIDPRDEFILPDGTTGPIVAIDGFFDGGTGVPYYSQVYLG